MNVDYLTGNEKPTAELMNDLFGALDAKLTMLLGGRSFFLAQTATLPQYLIGKAFFFTAGPAVYAPRVPGYIEANTSSNPVALPYNHAQFVAAQASAVFQPGYLKEAAIQNGGTGYLLNDVVTLAGGTVAAGGSPAQLQVTQRDATSGKILAVTLVTAGSYTVLPPTPNQVNGGHGGGAWLDCNLVQFDLYNKVAPVVKTGGIFYWNSGVVYPAGSTVNYYVGTTLEKFQALTQNSGVVPQGHPSTWQYIGDATPNSDVGIWEWSLAAHSVLYQGRNDKKPVRYYLQDGTTMPEKHFKFALAEIIIEGVPAVTMEKSWDKYACFRIHNLNATPATVTFADGNYVVKLTPYQCVTVRRDWNADTGKYENYRAGFNYFFKFEGGDPRFYWFFPTSGAGIGYGGKAANSMQANNLVNPAILYDWLLNFQRTADGATTFAAWNEDASVQCDIYPLLKKIFGDPSNPATPVGDLIHHQGDLVILRRPKKIYRLANSFGVVVQKGGKGYVPGDILTATGGIAIRASMIQVQAVDAQGGIISAVPANTYDGYSYPLFPPPTYNTPTGGSGSGAVLGLAYKVVNNDLVGGLSPFGNYYGRKDMVTFKGYATIAADFGVKQLGVAENASGNLVITNKDVLNDVFLFTISTNLLKTGEVIPEMVDLSGTNSFTVESAIFETDPENPVFANNPSSGSTAGLLTNTPTQIIQQPVETVATPQKTWTDVYDVIARPSAQGSGNPPTGYTYAGQDGIYVYFIRNPIPVNGTPQTTLDWTATGAIKLLAATIQDGGSGYAVGDVMNPALINPATPWLVGVANQDAEIQVTAVNGGRITGIKIAVAGSYTSAPYTPNFVVGGSGVGAIINLTFSNTFNGIHKKTVADLLTLDWWGDPTVPGQNSKNVVISNRAAMFTPHGLKLTFTETDSAVPGDTSGQSASLPTWASGKRGLPRYRQISFRAHGWGFVGVAHGNGAPIPPSGTTGIFSPTQGRQQALGGYRGEVVAPNGADFFTDGWTYGAPTKITLLTRIEPLSMTTDGRFWKLHGDNIWEFVYPPTYSWLDAAGNQIVPFLTNQSAYLPVMAMGLVVEMYNALARALNSVTTGTPLMWQCLFFNVSGFIINLDPRYGLGFGAGYSGIKMAAGGFTTNQYCYYNGPRPMNQFAAFDQGTIYEQLCNRLGIVVRTENDLPGGSVPGGNAQDLSYFQGKTSAPAVYVDFARIRSNGDTACAPQSLLVTFLDKPPLAIDVYSGTVTTTITTELLSTAAILAGKATGSKCLGTYDPSQFVAMGGYSLPGFPPPPPAYPDFSNAAPGSYYVANDGSGLICYYGSVGDNLGYLGQGGVQTNVLSGMAGKGQAYVNGSFVDLVNSFTAYRWVQIEDVQKAVVAFGFPFLWVELCTPLDLKYFEDSTNQATVTDQSTQVGSWQSAALGTAFSDAYAGAFDYIYNATGGDPTAIAKAIGDLNALKSTALQFTNSGMPGHGTLIKFCPTKNRRAKWKMPPFGAPTTSALGAPTANYSGKISPSTYGVPCEIVNVRSRNNLSPFFRCMSANWSIGVMKYDTTFGVDAMNWQYGPGIGVGINGQIRAGGQSYSQVYTYYYLQYGQRPTTLNGIPQLAVQYPTILKDAEFSDMQATAYNEGQLVDQQQTLGFNIYSSQPIAPIPVLLSGVPAWEKQRDWWGNLDEIYAATQQVYASAALPSWMQGNIPPQFVPPPQSQTAYVTEYFDGSNQNGLTIFSAAADQRFWCCFSLGYFDLNAITFGSQIATF